MFSIFKKKSLEDRIAEVKRICKEQEITHSSAYFMYMSAALELGWEDAAAFFCKEWNKERLRCII